MKGNRMYTDKLLTCRSCGGRFVFTAGEQEFYSKKGLRTEPQRCGLCRDKRKRRREFVLYEIVCEKCGEVAQVPFEPVPDRPAYCGECYRELKQ